MSISIIIPALNEASRIADHVRYLHGHGGEAVAEVIVVDGGSSDGTAERAAGAGARVLHSAVASRAAQMNAGARAATGSALYFVHADTVPPPSFATDIAAALDAGHVMGCYRYRFDSPRWTLKINAYFNRFPWLWCQGGDKTFFIRRDVFTALGGYDERFVIMEEYDFLRRARRRHRLHTVPKNAVVSARKYEHNGWWRVQFANALVFNLFRLGVEPVRLKRIYRSILR
jgi:rSAM/selenodomain-associated transferase 2